MNNQWINVQVLAQHKRKHETPNCYWFSIPTQAGLQVMIPKNCVKPSKSGLTYQLSFNSNWEYEVFKIHRETKIKIINGAWSAPLLINLYLSEWNVLCSKHSNNNFTELKEQVYDSGN